MNRIAPKLGYDTEEKNAYREDVIRSLFLCRSSDLSNKTYLCLPSLEGLEIPLVIARGISPENIIAVDRDAGILTTKWRETYPSVRAIVGEIENVAKQLAEEKIVIDYANLDLCGVRSDKTATILTTIKDSKIWALDARIAVTIIKGRDDLVNLIKFKAELKKSGDNRIYFAFNCLAKFHKVVKTGSYRLIDRASHTVEYGVMENIDKFNSVNEYAEDFDPIRKILTKTDLKINNDSKLDKAYVPSREEIVQLLNITKNGKNGKRNVALLVLSYFLGLSLTQISNLKIKDIITNAKINESFIVSNTHRNRVVYLSHEIVLSTLEDYINELKNNNRYHEDWYIFQQTNRIEKISFSALQALFSKLHKNVGINGRGQSGRRWFIFTLLDKGLDLNLVAELLGLTVEAVRLYLQEFKRKPLTTNFASIMAKI